jgi:plastocyanin
VNNLNTTLIKKSVLIVLVLFGLAVVLTSIFLLQPYSVYSQPAAAVSIVKGASSPSIAKPYDPSPLTIKTGTSVTWTNNDSTVHTVSSGLPEQGEVGTLFDSSLIAPGKTYTHPFDKIGTFDYSCTLHPFMRGQIIVK